jgi:putative acetyltransferase
MSTNFKVRRANADDVDLIAAVHVESIVTLGASAYSEEIVREWGAPRTGDRYRAAIDGGARFFVAVGAASEQGIVGFSSYRFERGQHRTVVYVAGRAARQGVGSALLRAAEEEALANGADDVHLDASLGAVEFYRANGFEELGRGEHTLRSGMTMPCVFMKKSLRASR